MNNRLPYVLLGAFLVLSGCTNASEEDLDPEGDADIAGEGVESENTGISEQALHWSGICRIEGVLEFPSKKHVFFVHISDPNAAYGQVTCSAWVGTSECCASKNPYGLTFDECKQLRHDPDCVPYGGGGPQSPYPEAPN
jgi:hypothetical protein